MTIKFDGNIEAIHIESKSFGKVYIDGKLMWQKDSGARPVQFDAVGAGYDYGQTPASWSGAGTGNFAVVWAYADIILGSGDITTAATYGGRTMDHAGSVWVDQGGFGFSGLVCHTLIDPPPGPQPAQVNISRAGAIQVSVAANSLTYKNVGSAVFSSNQGTGSGTGLSQNVASAEGEMVAQAFYASGLSSYNQTRRWERESFTIGDAPGAPNTNFTATRANNAPWAAAALRLIPA